MWAFETPHIKAHIYFFYLTFNFYPFNGMKCRKFCLNKMSIVIPGVQQ